MDQIVEVCRVVYENVLNHMELEQKSSDGGAAPKTGAPESGTGTPSASSESEADLRQQIRDLRTDVKRLIQLLEKRTVPDDAVPAKELLDMLNGQAFAKGDSLKGSDTVLQPAQAVWQNEVGIAGVEVEGNTTIPSAAILQRVRSSAMHPANPLQICEDTRKLDNTRWFSKVEHELRRTKLGTVLVFKVTERPLDRS